MKEFASGYSCFPVQCIDCQIDKLWQTGVEVDVNLSCIERDGELKSALRVPFDEVLFFMEASLFIVDDRVCVPSNLAKQVEHLGGDVFALGPSAIVAGLEHLHQLRLVSGDSPLLLLFDCFLVFDVQEVA